MQHPWVFVLAMGAAGCFGLLWLVDALHGMKRGEYKYRRAWFHKGEDGLGFWIVTGSMALVGATLTFAAIWMLVTFFWKMR